MAIDASLIGTEAYVNTTSDPVSLAEVTCLPVASLIGLNVGNNEIRELKERTCCAEFHRKPVSELMNAELHSEIDEKCRDRFL